MSATRPRYEYRVRWRRSNRQYAAVRFYQSEPHARRYVAKLTRTGRPDLAPIVELTIERRPVGAWDLHHVEIVEVLP